MKQAKVLTDADLGSGLLVYLSAGFRHVGEALRKSAIGGKADLIFGRLDVCL